MANFFNVQNRIQIIYGDIKSATFEPLNSCDLVIARSTLHHFNEPDKFWLGVKRALKPNGGVMVQALVRPAFKETAEGLARQCPNPSMGKLRYNSYMAAYRPEEVKAQLDRVGLGDRLTVVTDPNTPHIMFIANAPPKQTIYN